MGTSCWCRSTAIRHRSRSPRIRAARARVSSLPTAALLPTSRTRMAKTRSTCSRILPPERFGKFQPGAAPCLGGGGTGGCFSSARPMADSWPSRSAARVGAETRARWSEVRRSFFLKGCPRWQPLQYVLVSTLGRRLAMPRQHDGSRLQAADHGGSELAVGFRKLTDMQPRRKRSIWDFWNLPKNERKAIKPTKHSESYRAGCGGLPLRTYSVVLWRLRLARRFTRNWPLSRA